MSDIFKVKDIPLRFECLSQRSGICLCIKHEPFYAQRIAFHLSVGNQSLTSFAPPRPYETPPFVGLDAVKEQIDADGVLTFAFELVEICHDTIILDGSVYNWKVGKHRRSIYGRNNLSMGLSPLFNLSGFDCQLELYPCGEEEESGCAVHLYLPVKATVRYAISVSRVGDVIGEAMASNRSDLRQHHIHHFTLSCTDSIDTVVSICVR